MKILAFCLPFLLCLDAFSSDLPSRQNVIDVLAKNEHIRDVRNVELLAAQMRVENTSLQLNSKCTFLIKSDDQKDFYEQIKTVSNNPEAISNDNCDLSGINDEIERNRWNFSFHFGFTRTHYKPSDMRLTSSRMDVLIHDFEFQERTSAGFYNPANWEQFQDAFRWIDEPTNSFILTAKKMVTLLSFLFFIQNILNKRIKMQMSLEQLTVSTLMVLLILMKSLMVIIIYRVRCIWFVFKIHIFKWSTRLVMVMI